MELFDSQRSVRGDKVGLLFDQSYLGYQKYDDFAANTLL